MMLGEDMATFCYIDLIVEIITDGHESRTQKSCPKQKKSFFDSRVLDHLFFEILLNINRNLETILLSPYRLKFQNAFHFSSVNQSQNTSHYLPSFNFRLLKYIFETKKTIGKVVRVSIALVIVDKVKRYFGIFISSLLVH